MGQYHKVYNLDKKEYIHGHRIDLGLKLMEQCGFEGSTADAVWLLLANSNGRGGGDAIPHRLIGRWAGDRLLVQGDYAEIGDTAFLSTDEIESFTDISEDVKDLLATVFHLF
jgi:hypothetical protein